MLITAEVGTMVITTDLWTVMPSSHAVSMVFDLKASVSRSSPYEGLPCDGCAQARGTCLSWGRALELQRAGVWQAVT